MSLSSFDKQLILFSKGHFSKIDGFKIEDIISYEYDLDIKSVTEDILLRLLVESLQRVTEAGLVRFSYREMFSDMFRNRMYSGGNGKSIIAEDIISFILGQYSNIRVLNDDLTPIFDLGEVIQEIIDRVKMRSQESI